MTQDTRKFNLKFDDGDVVKGVSWHGLTDDNIFFHDDVKAMNKMAVGDKFDADFVVVKRTQ